MKIIALALTSMVFCVVPHRDETRNISAAVTDAPPIINMSYADPKTWHRLPAVAGEAPTADDAGLIQLSARSRPF